MPSCATVWAQLQELSKRLRNAASDVRTSSSPGTRWKAAGGTIIMKDIWTQPKLISTHGVEDFLYLWVQCATKTLNEAVVEGMGSVWAKAAPPERHVLLERSEKEAVIAWSAPQPWHPEAGARAGAFCTNALNHMFGFFTDGGSKGKPVQQGQAVEFPPYG